MNMYFFDVVLGGKLDYTTNLTLWMIVSLYESRNESIHIVDWFGNVVYYKE